MNDYYDEYVEARHQITELETQLREAQQEISRLHSVCADMRRAQEENLMPIQPEPAANKTDH